MRHVSATETTKQTYNKIRIVKASKSARATSEISEQHRHDQNSTIPKIISKS